MQGSKINAVGQGFFFFFYEPVLAGVIKIAWIYGALCKENERNGDALQCTTFHCAFAALLRSSIKISFKQVWPLISGRLHNSRQECIILNEHVARCFGMIRVKLTSVIRITQYFIAGTFEQVAIKSLGTLWKIPNSEMKPMDWTLFTFSLIIHYINNF